MQDRKPGLGLALSIVLILQLGPGAHADESSASAAASPAHTLAPLVRRVLPSVVGVRAERPVREELTVDPAAGFPDLPPSFGQTVDGAGVIVAADGLIVTCNHVIEGGRTVTITLSDGRHFEARTLLADREADLAVLKIAATGLPAAALGSSDLQPGDFVMAIGAALARGQSVSFGIVSALHRDFPGTKRHADLIQTDALLDAGSSGGPLLNLNGELIGINAARAGDGNDRGFGFAIPIDQVRSVMSKAATANF